MSYCHELLDIIRRSRIGGPHMMTPPILEMSSHAFHGNRQYKMKRTYTIKCITKMILFLFIFNIIYKDVKKVHKR